MCTNLVCNVALVRHVFCNPVPARKPVSVFPWVLLQSGEPCAVTGTDLVFATVIWLILTDDPRTYSTSRCSREGDKNSSIRQRLCIPVMLLANTSPKQVRGRANENTACLLSGAVRTLIGFKSYSAPVCLVMTGIQL